MRIDLVTLFPEFFSGPLSCGLLQRAVDKGLLRVGLHNPRLQCADRHKTVDDRPYGGGPGMVMLLEPLLKTLMELGHSPRILPGTVQPAALCETGLPGQAGQLGQSGQPACLNQSDRPGQSDYPGQPGQPGQSGQPAQPGGRILFMAPNGRPFTQAMARELAQEERLTIICGRYEGIDARLPELFPIEPVSMGDFVLNGGETAALAVVEAVGRLLPGFMGHEESGTEESFSAGLLEYPHYTRPETFAGLAVPPVLLGGDHKRIAAWRREEALRLTLAQRPDILADADLSEQDLLFLRSLPRRELGRNLFSSLVHYPILDKDEKSVASSLTNLDIHDIARSSCSYGLAGFYIVTPLEDQQALLRQLLRHWVDGAGSASNPDRATALALVQGVPSLQGCIEDITAKRGERPFIVGTSARKLATPVISFSGLRRKLESSPVLLLFGTGQGLAPEALELCDALLPPLRQLASYNHLSVRAAAALSFDRILSDWW